MKFLYWNVKEKSIQSIVVELAHQYELDVIILSECKFSLDEFLVELNTPVTRKYGLPVNPVPDPIIVSRLPRASFKLILDRPGISVRRLVPPIGPDILMFAVHLSSKLYQDKDDQTLFCTRLARYIDTEEKKIGHRRTLVVGDLNMNPFEAGVVGAEGLHGVMARTIAQKESRKVSDEEPKVPEVEVPEIPVPAEIPAQTATELPAEIPSDVTSTPQEEFKESLK